MGQDADGRAEAMRRIDEMLSRPESEGVRSMATGLYDAVLAEFGQAPPRDADALFRLCVGTVILAERRGISRQREVTEAAKATLEAMRSLAEMRKESLAASEHEVAGLYAVVDEQRRLIASMSRTLDREVAGLNATVASQRRQLDSLSGMPRPDDEEEGEAIAEAPPSMH